MLSLTVFQWSENVIIFVAVNKLLCSAYSEVHSNHRTRNANYHHSGVGMEEMREANSFLAAINIIT